MIVSSGFNDIIFSFILIIILLAFLISGYLFIKSSQREKEIIFGLLIINVILVAATLHLTAEQVHTGNIGLDENGIWYGEGVHFKKIMNVPLKGSIIISDNRELLYDLTKEEVVSLARGSHFPERLREEITIRYEKANVTLEDIPEGVDPSHLKLVISFNS